MLFGRKSEKVEGQIEQLQPVAVLAPGGKNQAGTPVDLCV